MKRSIFGTSVQGASHIRSGTECQDSYKKLICEDGSIIMAVADGHGSKSCPYSKNGSSIAVDVFCQIMSEYVSNFSANSSDFLRYLNREGEIKVAKAIDAEWKRCVVKKHKKAKRHIEVENRIQKLDSIYPLYGTTLLGLLITKEFIFALQIGDGDIAYISNNGYESIIQPEKILGVETHSMSKKDSWKNAITIVRTIDFNQHSPFMFIMSSDGFANSYKDSEQFEKTCVDYLDMVNQYGAETVEENLKSWLSETSALGCGDDITVLMAYFYDDNNIVINNEDIANFTEDNSNENVIDDVSKVDADDTVHQYEQISDVLQNETIANSNQICDTIICKKEDVSVSKNNSEVSNYD